MTVCKWCGQPILMRVGKWTKFWIHELSLQAYCEARQAAPAEEEREHDANA